MKLIKIILIALLIKIAISCSLTSQELDVARRQNILLEAERYFTNNYTEYTQISYDIFNETVITLRLESVGKFGPVDAIIYAGSLVPNPPIRPLPTSRQFPTPQTPFIDLINDDLYYVSGRILIFDDPNFETFDYNVKIDLVWQRQYIKFSPCSDQIESITYQSDQDYRNFQNSLGAINFPIEVICNIGYSGCVSTPYFNQTGYSSVEECIQQYSQIPPTPCPSILTANTLLCRGLHGLQTYEQPEVHCAHLVFNNSPVCTDSCLPYCANCDVNARCVEIFEKDNVIAGDLDNYLSYHCECNEGYIGNGTTCVANTCTAAYQCTSGHPHSFCNQTTGRCQCTDTLVWDGTDGSCSCRDDQNLFWENNTPYCLTKGKCLKRWQCPQNTDDYNSVKCRQPEHQNTLSLGDWCICNSGYDNIGIELNCVCGGNKTVSWSTREYDSENPDGSNICIGDGECADDNDCFSGTTCHFIGDESIGTCQ